MTAMPPSYQTGSMRRRDKVAGPTPSRTYAGLVLLYAPRYDEMAPAFLFSRPEMTVGREPSKDLVIPDEGVSRSHALLRYHNDEWHIQDVGSRHGVYVDGEKISEETVLFPGALVRMGAALFEVVGEGAEAYTRHRIDGVVAGEPAAEAKRRVARPIVGGAQTDLLLARAARVAASEVSVILHGESGTGKELLARYIHDNSKRKGPFLAVNCGGLPLSVLQAELFGVVRGAYSGADRDRPGWFRAANGGTLFLDEVGELPLDAQAGFLRALQEKVVVPVGGTEPLPADARIVCATHRDLQAMVREGSFRGDLLARLNGMTLTLLPLRERREDLYLLTTRYLENQGYAHKEPSVPFMMALLGAELRFNMRELQNALMQAAVLSENDELRVEHLPDYLREEAQIAYQLGSTEERVAGPSGHVEERRAQPLNGRSPGETGPLAKRRRAPSKAVSASGDVEQEPDTEKDKHERPSIEELVQVLADKRGNVAAVGRHYRRSAASARRWILSYGLRPEDFR